MSHGICNGMKRRKIRTWIILIALTLISLWKMFFASRSADPLQYEIGRKGSAAKQYSDEMSLSAGITPPIQHIFNHFVRSPLGLHLKPRLFSKLMFNMSYPAFNFTKPQFVVQDDEQLFFKNAQSAALMGKQVERGEIVILEHSSLDSSLDCGMFSDLKQFAIKRTSTKSQRISGRFVCPLLVPDGAYFQHFLDGVLPKISQVYDLIMSFNVTLLLFSPVDRIIVDFLREMKLYPDHVTWFVNSDLIETEWQLNSCITPRMHPLLWQRGRDLLGCKRKKSGSSVILIIRKNTRNGGRRMLNKDETVNYLQKRYHKDLVLFYGGLSFRESREIFQKARIVIGVHGGGLYNINMAPSNVTVIEVMPTEKNGYIPQGLAHTMIWRMSQLLEQTYWRIPAAPIGGNLNVPLPKLVRILDITDYPQKFKIP